MIHLPKHELVHHQSGIYLQQAKKKSNEENLLFLLQKLSQKYSTYEIKISKMMYVLRDCNDVSIDKPESLKSATLLKQRSQ